MENVVANCNVCGVNKNPKLLIHGESQYPVLFFVDCGFTMDFPILPFNYAVTETLRCKGGNIIPCSVYSNWLKRDKLAIVYVGSNHGFTDGTMFLQDNIITAYVATIDYDKYINIWQEIENLLNENEIESEVDLFAFAPKYGFFSFRDLEDAKEKRFNRT